MMQKLTKLLKSKKKFICIPRQFFKTQRVNKRHKFKKRIRKSRRICYNFIYRKKLKKVIIKKIVKKIYLKRYKNIRNRIRYVFKNNNKLHFRTRYGFLRPSYRKIKKQIIRRWYFRLLKKRWIYKPRQS